VGKDKKRQKDLQRRLGQRKAEEAGRAIQQQALQALQDPEQFAAFLRRFAQLALLLPPLQAVRYPGGAFVKTMLALEVPEDQAELERARFVRREVAQALAEPQLLTGYLQAIDAAFGQVKEQQDMVALMAGRALISSCVEEPSPEHAFWNLLVDLSLSEALLSGHFLIRLVLNGLEPDRTAVAAAFARALAKEDLARELDELGADELDASRLAEAYAGVVSQDEPYHLQFDAVLHLAALHVGLTEGVGNDLTRVGPTAALKQAFLDAYEGAYRADVGQGIVDELAGWFRRRLEVLRDDPARIPGIEADDAAAVARERERCLVIYLALRSLPPEENDFLRATHVSSLLLARVQVSELEAPFVSELWSNPTDTFALEEYERFLLERGEHNRARRVRAFVKDAREARRLKAEAAKAAEAEAAGAEGGASGGGEAPPPAGDLPGLDALPPPSA